MIPNTNLLVILVTQTELAMDEGTYTELVPFGVQQVSKLSVSGAVYELIGIVSSDSESETSFENYLENFHDFQSMVRTKQTARGGKPTHQGTPATLNPDNTGNDNGNEGGKQRKLIPETPLRKTAPPPPRKTGWQTVAWWNHTAHRGFWNESKRQWRECPEYKKNAQGHAIHHRKPGTLALWEIAFYQSTQVFLIAIKAFVMVVQEIGQDVMTDLSWKPEVFFALQQAAEAFLTGWFSDTNIAAIHCKRVTISIKDMKLAAKICQHLPVGGTKQTKCYEMHV